MGAWAPTDSCSVRVPSTRGKPPYRPVCGGRIPFLWDQASMPDRGSKWIGRRAVWDWVARSAPGKRDLTATRARDATTAWAPGTVQRMPLRLARWLTTTLASASTRPEPIARFRARKLGESRRRALRAADLCGSLRVGRRQLLPGLEHRLRSLGAHGFAHLAPTPRRAGWAGQRRRRAPQDGECPGCPRRQTGRGCYTAVPPVGGMASSPPQYPTAAMLGRASAAAASERRRR